MLNLPFWNKELEILLKLMSESTRFFPRFDNKKLLDLVKNFENKNSIVETEIVQCRKSLLVGLAEDVLAEKQYLSDNYGRQEFYIPEDFMQLLSDCWVFMLFGKSKVPFYHNQFTVAGIPEKLEQLKRERQYLKRREGTRKLKRLFTVFGYVVPLALTGPIRTVFYLYLGMIGVCILGYLMEIMRTRSPRLIVQKLRSSSGKILQCINNECNIIIYFVLGLGKPIHSVLRLLRRSFYLRLSPKCWLVNRK